MQADNAATSFDHIRAEAANMNARELREAINAIRGNPKRGPRRGFTEGESLALSILLDEEARRAVCPRCGAKQGQNLRATEAGCIFCAD